MQGYCENMEGKWIIRGEEVQAQAAIRLEFYLDGGTQKEFQQMQDGNLI